MPSSWQVASRSWLYEPNGVGGATTAISLDARRLRRHGRHQHRRRIRRRAAGHADADARAAAGSAAAGSRRAAFRSARRGAGSPSGIGGCCRECGGSFRETSARPSAWAAASSCGRHAQRVGRELHLSSSLAVYSSTASRPRVRTSRQIRSTTWPATAARRTPRSSSSARPR